MSAAANRSISAPAPQAGWKLDTEFCPQARVSRAMVYKLPKHLQPRSVWIGRARIVTESPTEWLARLGASQEAA